MSIQETASRGLGRRMACFVAQSMARYGARCRARFGARFRAISLLVTSLILLGAAGPAHALYRYDFLSDPMTVTWNYEGFPSWVTEEHMKVSILTNTLLGPETYLNDILSFTISVVPSATYTNPKSITLPMNESPCFCIYEGDLWVGTVDSNSLPLTWAIWTWRSDYYPGSVDYGLHSNTMTENFYVHGWDSNFREYNMSGSFVNENGALGGVWTLAVVPEPATHAMLLGGLVVVGALARRRGRRMSD